VREDGNCRSGDVWCGAATLMVAMQLEFNWDPDALFARGEAGTVFFFEVAQQALFAQQPGLQAFCTGASVIMQVRVEA